MVNKVMLLVKIIKVIECKKKKSREGSVEFV